MWTAPSELEGENKVTKKTTKEVEYLRGIKMKCRAVYSLPGGMSAFILTF